MKNTREKNNKIIIITIIDFFVTTNLAPKCFGKTSKALLSLFVDIMCCISYDKL